jgi:hypothetical protein
MNEWEEHPMLVHIASLVDGPNGSISSLVGLYFIHEKVKECAAIDVYLSLYETTFKFIRRQENREFVSEVAAKGFGRQSLADFPPRMVKSAIQIMDSIPDQQSDVSWGLPIAKVVLDEFLSGVRVRLDDGGVGISQDLNSLLKVNDVLIGPFDFEVGAPKLRAHDKKVYANELG